MRAVAAAPCREQQRLKLAQADQREGFLARQVPVVGEIAERRRAVCGAPEARADAR